METHEDLPGARIDNAGIPGENQSFDAEVRIRLAGERMPFHLGS